LRLLNSLPMGFYSASQLIQDAARHGIRVLPVDAQHSDWDHTLAPLAEGAAAPPAGGADTQPPLRLGLRLVKAWQRLSAGASPPPGRSAMPTIWHGVQRPMLRPCVSWPGPGRCAHSAAIAIRLTGRSRPSTSRCS
jgi:hypothetical protein